jgi:hypothetical protein
MSGRSEYELYDGLHTNYLGPSTVRRCDACDCITQLARQRVRLTAVPPSGDGLLVCKECATYLVGEGIATKVIRPRGIRKAGRGEMSRCNRFCD